MMVVPIIADTETEGMYEDMVSYALLLKDTLKKQRTLGLKKNATKRTKSGTSA